MARLTEEERKIQEEEQQTVARIREWTRGTLGLYQNPGRETSAELTVKLKEIANLYDSNPEGAEQEVAALRKEHLKLSALHNAVQHGAEEGSPSREFMGKLQDASKILGNNSLLGLMAKFEAVNSLANLVNHDLYTHIDTMLSPDTRDAIKSILPEKITPENFGPFSGIAQTIVVHAESLANTEPMKTLATKLEFIRNQVNEAAGQEPTKLATNVRTISQMKR